ncbi:MAG TPA: hypothetical protein VME68_02650 [Acidobacteriaceae bacterium]|nr:hypothetical protein [Acidobacteriaceae bacterium]
MRSFLDRIASGVLHAQPAIHPSVGTLWSSPATKAPAMMEPLAPDTSAEVLAPPSPYPASRESHEAPTQARPLTEPPGSSSQPSELSQGDAEEPGFVERVAFHPLVTAQRPIATPLRASPADAATEQSVAAMTAQEPTVAATQRSRVLPVQTTESVQPLVPAPPVHTSAISAAGRRAPDAAASPRRQQPANLPTDERDSIEIHIGRIEVLAAPPRPAQPAAPKPAPKSLDLGEYLRRERRPQ